MPRGVCPVVLTWDRRYNSAMFRRLLQLPALVAYRYLYAPLMTWLDDFKHRHDPPLPPVPCQLCGKPGHRERYCPNAHGMGL